MKLLHIVRQFYPLIGGMENYVYNLASQQINQGHTVTIVTLNRSFESNEKLDPYERLGNGIEIYRIPFFLSKKYTLAPKTFRYLKHYDLIHVHGVNFFSDYIALTKRFHKKKIILTTHGGFFHTKWGNFIKKFSFHTITRVTLKAYDAVIGCSENDLQLFKNICPGIIKIDNGVNVNSFLKITKNPVKNTLLFVGRLDVNKRVDNLIHLIARLKTIGFHAHLFIVGPDWSKLIPRLNSLSSELNVKEQITFTGPVSEEELRNYFSKAWLFVSASEYEGFGISAIEALASGTPCVLNNIPSFQTILKEQPFGKICNYNDIDDTADTIIKFNLQLNDEYTELSHQAKTYSKQYDWEKVAEKIMKVYEQIVAAKR